MLSSSKEIALVLETKSNNVMAVFDEALHDITRQSIIDVFRTKLPSFCWPIDMIDGKYEKLLGRGNSQPVGNTSIRTIGIRSLSIAYLAGEKQRRGPSFAFFAKTDKSTLLTYFLSGEPLSSIFKLAIPQNHRVELTE
ncbi:hypothetical protein SNE40_014623 [Patella caerulea]|uniref:Uncharacterized protein n=1 Tax=Patella caerulea TaxID=87958 RepID=A0AAN8JH99_PATCE